MAKHLYTSGIQAILVHMFTTANLPEAMRADFDAELARAVRDSRLKLDAARCDHGRYDCPACVVEAARRLVEAASREPVG